MTDIPCPVCQVGATIRFLRREDVPVQQNILMASEAAARAIPRGTLDLHVCPACGFIFNTAFDAALLDYGKDYDNTQSFSDVFEAHMDGLVRDLVEREHVRNARIVEIGCGKGQFLRKLVEWPGSGNTGIGFDTSYIGPSEDLDGRLHFERTFYDERAASVPADAVVCRHVIEHVPRPRELMESVRGALAGSPDARLWFETPCVEWILRNNVLWDFFYEHCSLFTAHSLARLFHETGFAVREVRDVFGGQYLWLEAAPSPLPAPTEAEAAPHTAELALAYGHRVEEQRAGWHRRLTEPERRGRVALWGAGAKGATFANLIDPDAQLIDCVVDVNPAKQGRFIPGTGHRIAAPEDLAARHIAAVLVMNPNYRAEIAAQLREVAPATELLEWSAP